MLENLAYKSMNKKTKKIIFYNPDIINILVLFLCRFFLSKRSTCLSRTFCTKTLMFGHSFIVLSDPFLWLIGGSPFLYPRNFWKSPKYMYRICRICMHIHPLDIFGNGFIVSFCSKSLEVLGHLTLPPKASLSYICLLSLTEWQVLI